jgi:hypothetical protein
MRILNAVYPPDGGASMGPKGDEPGQEDNRLSLDPNDPRWKKLLDDWSDGESYSVNVQIEQISPGEFRITALKEAAAPETDEAPAAEGGTPGAEDDDTDDTSPMKSSNPAVQGMMD